MNFSCVNIIAKKFADIIHKEDNSFWEDIKSSLLQRTKKEYEYMEDKGIEIEGFYYDVCVEVRSNFIHIVLPKEGILYRKLDFFELEDDTKFIKNTQQNYHNCRGWINFNTDQMDFFSEVRNILENFFRKTNLELFNELTENGEWIYCGVYNLSHNRINFIMESCMASKPFKICLVFERKYPSVSKTLVESKTKVQHKCALKRTPSSIEPFNADTLDESGIYLFYKKTK